MQGKLDINERPIYNLALSNLNNFELMAEYHNYNLDEDIVKLTIKDEEEELESPVYSREAEIAFYRRVLHSIYKREYLYFAPDTDLPDLERVPCSEESNLPIYSKEDNESDFYEQVPNSPEKVFPPYFTEIVKKNRGEAPCSEERKFPVYIREDNETEFHEIIFPPEEDNWESNSGGRQYYPRLTVFEWIELLLERAQEKLLKFSRIDHKAASDILIAGLSVDSIESYVQERYTQMNNLIKQIPFQARDAYLLEDWATLIIHTGLGSEQRDRTLASFQQVDTLIKFEKARLDRFIRIYIDDESSHSI